MNLAYCETSRTSTTLEEVQRATTVKMGRAYGHFKEMLLDSAFQPIYSLSHRRIVGHEGLMRASTAQGSINISPLQVLNSADNDSQSVFLDRLCRAIHLHNYQPRQGNNQWLFLNVSAQVINRRRDHEPFFAELLANYDVTPNQIVVEIVEGVIPDFHLLAEAVEFYRNAGCVVAIDDFGAEASDIERIWRASPDIVKLDRKLIAAAEFNHKARRILCATVALIHEAGSLALLEGIENTEQAMIALDSNADMVQGFHFSRPAATPLMQGDGGIGLLATSHLPPMFEDKKNQLLQPYLLEFKCALLRLTSGLAMESASATLISLPKIDRCYVLNASGEQIGHSLMAKKNEYASRFAPLADTTGTNWAQKPYHYRAILQPNEVQISRPYLSITSARQCITLSSTFQMYGELQVLCCDIEWQE
ncbi:MAG: EAL domain-containing protein [Methylotenera sp.]|uniref:EAL domain-containing protein n=1 Tax=Methylotenera sp. TaxID=2051956 RepID=UPI00248A79B3|nr:EAL domain-containing protein [Methylotenera sp.]MDI1308463.1 EAL domain-containing protein [Methylotenera sp.]